jgi:hypothetical protein
MGQLHQRTALIDQIIRSAELNLVTLWENDFDNNNEMESIKPNKFNLGQPPKLRDAFNGGCTEPFEVVKKL